MIVFLLTGCASSDVTTSSGREAATPTASAESSTGAEVPENNPALDRTDDAGRTPDGSVLALIEARNQADWQAAYSLYATPSVDFTTAEREWIEAEEVYDEFRVVEVRVTSIDAAWVRVTYVAKIRPLSSATYPVVVEEPGEWWPVHKVDGRWKTQWMPRQ
jgi:hypothetical protein